MNLYSSNKNKSGSSEFVREKISWDSGPVLLAIYANENRPETVRELVNALKKAGFRRFDIVARLQPFVVENICPICGWIHDLAFSRIQTPGGKINLGAGLLPEIVAAVHRAHENSQKGLNTKDDELKKICGGYKNPCKAFDDLNHRQDYKILFFTRRRGLISLKGAVGINRIIA